MAAMRAAAAAAAAARDPNNLSENIQNVRIKQCNLRMRVTEVFLQK